MLSKVKHNVVAWQHAGLLIHVLILFRPHALQPTYLSHTQEPLAYYYIVGMSGF